MAGRADGGERVVHRAAHDQVDAMHTSARRAQRRLGAAGTHGGIGVDVDGVAFLGPDRQDGFDDARGMHPDQLLHGRLGRLFPDKAGELRRVERPQHRAQPVGAFRVIRAGIMLQAGRMGDQRGGQIRGPLGVRRRDQRDRRGGG